MWLGRRALIVGPRHAASLGVLTLLFALGLLTPRPLGAQRAAQLPPRCSGTDVAAAAAAIASGDSHMERAATQERGARASRASREYEAAIADYASACEAGADVALERRAIPLARLGRHVEAVASLDAFLRLHPLASLSSDDQSRIGSNLRALSRSVGTIDVGSIPAATVWLGDERLGETPLVRRVEGDTDVTLRIESEGFEPRTITLHAAAGMTDRLRLELAPLRSTGGAAAHAQVDAQSATPTTSAQGSLQEATSVEPTPGPATEQSTASAATIDASTRTAASTAGRGDSNALVWVVVGAVTAAVGVGLVIGGGSLWTERQGGYDELHCGLTMSLGMWVPGCAELGQERDVGIGLTLGGAVLALAGGLTATFAAIELASSTSERSALVCAPGPASVACRMTF